MITLSAEVVINMRQTLASFHDVIAEFLNIYDPDPLPESIAAQELTDDTLSASLSTAYSQGNLLLESAADHSYALTRLLEEPIPTLAPWTCVRGGLEAAALSCWLLNTHIGVRRRVSRSYAFRFEGLVQQLKTAHAANKSDSTETILSRMDELEADAGVLGYSPILNQKKKRIGIAEQMPSATECIASELDEEVLFRIFSAMAHARPWALIKLGFRAPDENVPTTLTKSLTNEAAALLISTSANNFAKPIWYRASLFGYDLSRLSQLLKQWYQRLGLSENQFFWEQNEPR